MSTFNKFGVAIGLIGLTWGILGLVLFKNWFAISSMEASINILIALLVLFIATRRPSR